MPRQNPRVDCVSESILLPCGAVETILLDERYAPYEKRGARIENLCGSFAEFVQTGGFEKVLTKNGSQRELYHLQGNVVVNQGKGAFMAVRGMAGLTSIARALRLSSPANVVHMAVITSKLGKRAQVTTDGLLETTLAKHSALVRIKGRIYEHTNSVCFSVQSFQQAPLHLPEAYVPDKNDWTVTGKGMLIIRLIWQRLEWSDEVERSCLAFCNRATEWLLSCC
jgi:hypothetical protein